MRILGVDSSGMVASVALVEDDLLVAEYSVNYKKTHSQTLLPMLDEIVKMTELDLNTIDAIAVAAGPGSFTGLRIGAATVKGLGLALEKQLYRYQPVTGLRIICGAATSLSVQSWMREEARFIQAFMNLRRMACRYFWINPQWISGRLRRS